MTILEAYLNERCAISQPCERVLGVYDTQTEYDFIVVGGGTAGAIVAGRLSENGTNKVGGYRETVPKLHCYVGRDV